MKIGWRKKKKKNQNMSYLSNYLGVSTASGAYNYRMKTNDVNIYQADDFVHAYLADDTERFPEKVDIFLTEEDYKNGKNPQKSAEFHRELVIRRWLMGKYLHS